MRAETLLALQVVLGWSKEPALRREAREGGGVSRRGSPPDH